MPTDPTFRDAPTPPDFDAALGELECDQMNLDRCHDEWNKALVANDEAEAQLCEASVKIATSLRDAARQRVRELYEAVVRERDETAANLRVAMDTIDKKYLRAAQQGEVYVVLDGPTEKSGMMVVHPEQPGDKENWPRLRRVRVTKVEEADHD